MGLESTGCKFETDDGESGFKFKATGGSKAIAGLERIMNDVEARMKEESNQ